VRTDVDRLEVLFFVIGILVVLWIVVQIGKGGRP
jgi:predicted nucleic acid-binding Zn ribbon protein